MRSLSRKEKDLLRSLGLPQAGPFPIYRGVRGAKPPQEIVEAAWRAKREGWPKSRIAMVVGLSRAHLQTMFKAAEQREDASRPKLYHELDAKARRGVDDFLFFSTTYLKVKGKAVEAPAFWEEMAQVLSEVPDLEAGEIHQVLINIHPGVGKTTCILAYLTWRLVRERALGHGWFSVAYGSRTEKLSRAGMRQIKEWLNSKDLNEAYGRFQPSANDPNTLWTVTEIAVAGLGEGKEATFSVWATGAAIKGSRPNIWIWDDLIGNKDGDQTRTEEVVEWWDNDARDRVEPGGVMGVVGNYVSPVDFYHHLKDQIYVFDGPGGPEETKAWQHVKFPAHDENKCPRDGTHPAYPAGCLLWPERFGFKALEKRRQDNEAAFEIQFQQTEQPLADVLVPQRWMRGGTSTGGEIFPGCLDHSREMWTPVEPQSDRAVIVATLDPSPTKFASVQVWMWDPPFDILLAMERRRMRTPEYPEVIRDWTHRIRETYPEVGGFDTWVIERTGAIYLLEQDPVQELISSEGIIFVPHECVDTETEVLSDRGWLCWDEVEPGQNILTLNMRTQEAEWQDVRYVYRGLHDGPMIRIRNIMLDALVTPDHRWPVSDARAQKPLRFVETRDLNTNCTIPLARPLTCLQEPAEIYPDDVVELVGWAATEGYFPPKHGGVEIGQSDRVNGPNVERIRLALKRLEASWREEVNAATGVRKFCVRAGPLCDLLRNVTHGVKQGRGRTIVPGFILALPRSQRELLTETLLAGDGWTYAGTRNFCSDDEGLIQAWEMLSALNGCSTYRTTRRDRPHHKVVRAKNRRYAYGASLRAEDVPYRGIVWCPNTINGTFYARRGGRTYFTGNTQGSNKHHQEYGVWGHRNQFKYGRVRLPWAMGPTREMVRIFCEEHEKFPWFATDDTVLGSWFFQLAKEKVPPPLREAPTLWRPSWLLKDRRVLA